MAIAADDHSNSTKCLPSYQQDENGTHDNKNTILRDVFFNVSSDLLLLVIEKKINQKRATLINLCIIHYVDRECFKARTLNCLFGN